jgi:hypothetical protein
MQARLNVSLKLLMWVRPDVNQFSRDCPLGGTSHEQDDCMRITMRGRARCKPSDGRFSAPVNFTLRPRVSFAPPCFVKGVVFVTNELKIRYLLPFRASIPNSAIVTLITVLRVKLSALPLF